ncbi:glutaminyl-peptide cyclotransferase [Sphingobacterium pedocola]|uniref:Glutamine cyclotransferase n=1 Tax=Sphingobacterium pedocola TaxID=2082722 RepID=A0ABR9TB53_9SPHI|nr:glutaminyl-peptide cyclotransferase [Sphingobacterium pedocola]MBE8722109.1 glutamine cyclotransferase [Sphingobacterium pedocola]
MCNKSIRTVVLALALVVGGCKTQKGKLEFVMPESGQKVLLGEQVKLKLNFSEAAIDSVIYSVDGNILERKKDTSGVVLDTQRVGLGDRSITAKVYVAGKEDIAYSNVTVIPPSAKNYGFEVVNVFPHDDKAFTQGLQYEGGILYETTGRTGESSLRKVDLQTGKVTKIVPIGDEYFGEGMTIAGDKIVVLTWQENVGFFYNKNTFEKTGSFSYGNSKEGWGLTYDGQRLIKSDGSHLLYFLDPTTGKETGSIGVYDENGAVDNLNELEYIDGKVYANVYQQEIIVVINPETGAVESRINLVGMNTENRQPVDNELNGIAYDAVGKRLFVTGKLWSKLYEIKTVER